jgi:hypothetical protein
MGCADPSSRFVSLRKSETEREQLVLLAYRPRTHKTVSFAPKSIDTVIALIDDPENAAEITRLLTPELAT